MKTVLIEKLRAGLILALIAMIAWIAAGIGSDATPLAASSFPNGSLCLHSRDS